MQHQVKELDFGGQNIYVGLDTHRSQTTVTVLGENLHHKTFSQPTAAGANVGLKMTIPCMCIRY